MSTAEDKQNDRERGGKARRTFQSLKEARGFSMSDTGIITIRGIEESKWACISPGKTTARDAMYEQVGE